MSATSLATAPAQYDALQDIHDIDPLGESDYGCLEEVREVLKKHGKGDRFGVTLLHKHFDLREDEILVEYTDVDGREQLIKPEKKSDALDNSIETSWRFGDGKVRPMLACVQYCAKNIHGNHDSFHK